MLVVCKMVKSTLVGALYETASKCNRVGLYINLFSVMRRNFYSRNVARPFLVIIGEANMLSIVVRLFIEGFCPTSGFVFD